MSEQNGKNYTPKKEQRLKEKSESFPINVFKGLLQIINVNLIYGIMNINSEGLISLWYFLPIDSNSLIEKAISQLKGVKNARPFVYM